MFGLHRRMDDVTRLNGRIAVYMCMKDEKSCDLGYT
jgi:hypothetical protein